MARNPTNRKLQKQAWNKGFLHVIFLSRNFSRARAWIFFSADASPWGMMSAGNRWQIFFCTRTKKGLCRIESGLNRANHRQPIRFRQSGGNGRKGIAQGQRGRATLESSAMRAAKATCSDAEFLLEQRVDRLRIGFATGRLHDLADEPTDHGRLCLHLFDLVWIAGDDLVHGALDRAGVGDLL
jgi:hypothetical protein